MMKLLAIYLMAFSAAFTGVARAEGNLSVTDAVNLALAQNPNLKAAELDVESGRADKLKAWSAQLPHVHLQAQHMIENKFQLLTVPFNGVNASFPAVTPYTIASLKSSLLLFDGFATWDRISAASLAAEARASELSRARFALETEIRTKFYQALGAAALVEVADQNIATLEQHQKDVSSRIRAGVATKFDLLRVEVLLEDAKIAKLSAEDDKIISRKKLWQALGVADDGRALAGGLPESWDALPSDLGGPKPEYRDDRRAALLLEESAAKISRAEGRFWLPTLSLFGDYDQYNNINRTLLGSNSQYNDAYALGLALSWNLFDGGNSWAERTKANVRAEKASLRMKEIDDALPVDFELWRRRYVYSVAAFQAKKVAVRKAEESIRIAKTSARAGTRTNTEVLDAVRDLNEEKAKLVQAQVEAIEALGNLELAYGQPLRGVSLHAEGGGL